MVPTAPILPAANPLHPVRRHIGQPLDSLESGGRRPAKSTNRAAIDERTSVAQRTTGLDPRAANSDRRMVGNVARSGAT